MMGEDSSHVDFAFFYNKDGELIGKMEDIQEICIDKDDGANETHEYVLGNLESISMKFFVSRNAIRRMHNLFILGWRAKGYPRKRGLANAWKTKKTKEANCYV